MFNMQKMYSLKKVLYNSRTVRFLTKNLTITALFSIKPDPLHSSGCNFVFYEAGNNVATVVFPINVNITSNKPTFCSTCSFNLRSAAYCGLLLLCLYLIHIQTLPVWTTNRVLTFQTNTNSLYWLDRRKARHFTVSTHCLSTNCSVYTVSCI